MLVIGATCRDWQLTEGSVPALPETTIGSDGRPCRNLPAVIFGSVPSLSRRGVSGCVALRDEIGEPRHIGGAGHSKAAPQIVPE